MLQAFLDWQRATLLHKCAGLTGEQLARRAIPPSELSLLGLVRHMTKVERTWFRQRFAGEQVDYAFGANPPGECAGRGQSLRYTQTRAGGRFIQIRSEASVDTPGSDFGIGGTTE